MFDLCVKGTSNLASAHRLLNPPSMQSWTQEQRKKSGLLTLLSEQKRCVTSERGSLKTLCYGWFEHSISFCSKALSGPFEQHAAWLGHTSMSCLNTVVCVGTFERWWHIFECQCVFCSAVNQNMSIIIDQHITNNSRQPKLKQHNLFHLFTVRDNLQPQ